MFCDFPLTHRTDLATALTELMRDPGYGGGREFEVGAMNLIAERTGAKLISTEEFAASFPGMKRKARDYARSKTCEDSGCWGLGVERKDPGQGLIIVDQPNGTQEFPDALLIWLEVGLGIPIEFKSSKTATPTWNSGLPRLNAIYVFQRSGKRGGVTTFFGKHVISAEEIAKFREMREAAEAFYAKTNAALEALGGGWSGYQRPMHLQKGDIFSGAMRRVNEQEVIDALSSPANPPCDQISAVL